MAFKSFSQFQEDKQGDFFVLPNDGDFADVIFLYRSANDVLVADVHYISTSSYKGYAHCCGPDCPACKYPTQSGKGIRKDNKIFIPLYNISKGKIEFWDRSTFFESVLQTQVFKNYPNPSMCVFRITRRGAAGSRDTKYDIEVKFRNSAMPYEKICADFKISFPDAYSAVCKEMTVAEMDAALNSASVEGLPDYGYTPVPRGESATSDLEPINVQTPVYSAPPVDVPPAVDASVSDIADLPEYNSASVPPVADAPSGDSGDDLDNVAF